MAIKTATMTAVMAMLLMLPMLNGASAQEVAHRDEAVKQPHRIHLILKDGSYQVVLRYTVAGKIVRYFSAERGGEQEEIPLELVDLEATHRWEREHAATQNDAEQGRPPAIDPELLKEEQERASLTPEVMPDLRLPEEDSVVVLDEFQGGPELVPLVQTDGDLNHTTSHSVLKKAINPRAASHVVLTLKGVKSDVQLHVDAPVFYLRLDDGTQAAGGGAPLVVDTHGASSTMPHEASNPAGSRYVIVQADVRTDARLVASNDLFSTDGSRRGDDVVEVKSEALPGGHWIKLTPERSIQFGEYVLLEVLSDKEVNAGVWDFGIHPTAAENRDALKPQPKQRPDLGRRRQD